MSEAATLRAELRERGYVFPDDYDSVNRSDLGTLRSETNVLSFRGSGPSKLRTMHAPTVWYIDDADFDALVREWFERAGEAFVSRNELRPVHYTLSEADDRLADAHRKIADEIWGNGAWAEAFGGDDRGDDDEYVCPKCGKTFDTERQRAGHMQTHSEYGESACGVCGKTFSTPQALNGHRYHVHGLTGDDPDPETETESEPMVDALVTMVLVPLLGGVGDGTITSISWDETGDETTLTVTFK